VEQGFDGDDITSEVGTSDRTVERPADMRGPRNNKPVPLSPLVVEPQLVGGDLSPKS
jgi:hypothetical protein